MMAITRRLPDNPNLERLKSEAKDFQRRIRAGDQQARADAGTLAGRDLSAEFDQLRLSTAQWLVARSYGYPSWPKLRHRVEIIAQYARFPEPAGERPEDEAEVVDHFLRLSVLNYTEDRSEHLVRAQQLFVQRPELAEKNIFTCAVAGRHRAIGRLLTDDPGLVDTDGGPHLWQPLIYLTSARLPDDHGDPLSALAEMLDAGADANAGYLWHGLPSPFTALTCALGGGEQNQPPHPEALELARMLLEAGADPNDNQALYNRMFRPENDHLELLFRYGLGEDRPSPWRDRLGDSYPTTSQMLGEQLRWAAAHGLTERVRLLLDHGIDPDNRGYHPNYADRSASELALDSGHTEIVTLLGR